MKVLFTCLLVILTGVICEAQESTSWEFEHIPELQSGVLQTKTIINEDNNFLYTFVYEKKKVVLYELNEKREVVNSHSWDIKDMGLINFRETMFLGETLHCLSDFYGQTFIHKINLKSGSVENITCEYAYKNERVISSSMYSNQFYFFTVSNEDSKIRMYTYNGINQVKSQRFDYDEKSFISKDEWFLIASNYRANIKTNQKIGIQSTFCPIKTYSDHNKISITIENKCKTHTFQIDLDNLQTNFYVNNANVSKSKITPFVKSNSFLFEDKLFQIISKKMGKEIDVYIKELETDELLKSFAIKRKEPIAFANSEMVWETKAYEPVTLDNTREFLGLALDLNSNLCLSVNKTPNGLQMDLGGVRLGNNSSNLTVSINGVMAAINLSTSNRSKFGVLGSLDANHIVPSIETQFQNYYYTSVTSIKCLLDSEFNSVSGDIKDNVLDQVKHDNFVSKNRKGKTLSHGESQIIYNYYDKSRQTCVFRKYVL